MPIWDPDIFFAKRPVPFREFAIAHTDALDPRSARSYAALVWDDVRRQQRLPVMSWLDHGIHSVTSPFMPEHAVGQLHGSQIRRGHCGPFSYFVLLVSKAKLQRPMA